MRSMFYKYDRDMEEKPYPPMSPTDVPKSADGFSGARPVFNAKGDSIGVKASCDSPFDLYFAIEGEVEGSSVAELLAECSLDLKLIHGKTGEEVGSIACEPLEDLSGVKATIDPGAIGLGPNVYRLRLELSDGEGLYTLFSEKDGFLSLS